MIKKELLEKKVIFFSYMLSEYIFFITIHNMGYIRLIFYERMVLCEYRI